MGADIVTPFNPERCREVMALLHQQAAEIARDGHSGWGNTMAEAADQLESALAEIEQLQEAVDLLKKVGNDMGADIETLRAAITQTLDENGHLADGDNCTLAALKRVMAAT